MYKFYYPDIRYFSIMFQISFTLVSLRVSLYFRCDINALEDALCKRVMITPEEIIKRTLDPESATVSRDGLAKTIYSRLFDW